MNNNDLSVVLSLAISLISKGAEAMALANKMHAEGRDKLTPEEWDMVLMADGTARARLEAAIAAAKAPPPPPPAPETPVG